jgi:hypothetical protein
VLRVFLARGEVLGERLARERDERHPARRCGATELGFERSRDIDPGHRVTT